MVRIVTGAGQCRVTEHSVELAATQAPRTVPVDCAAGGSITQVLADEPVLPPLTIDITGTCTEAASIDRDNVTLRGVPGTDAKPSTASQPSGLGRYRASMLVWDAARSLPPFAAARPASMLIGSCAPIKSLGASRSSGSAVVCASDGS